MKLLVFVLNKIEKLDALLEELANNQISGATIFRTTGMVRELMSRHELGIFGSFRHLLDADRKENRTLFMVVKTEQIAIIEKVIDQVVGNIDEPDTGILFTLPVESVRGYKH